VNKRHPTRVKAPRPGPSSKPGDGILLSGLNPKNLLLAVRGAAAIAQTGISTAQEVADVGAVRRDRLDRRRGTGGDLFRPRRALGRAARPPENWVARNNSVIMAVLLLIIGVKLIGDAITGFST
jgi:hypothetical protein